MGTALIRRARCVTLMSAAAGVFALVTVVTSGAASAAPLLATDDAVSLPQGFRKVILQPLANDSGASLRITAVAPVGEVGGRLTADGGATVTYSAPEDFAGTDAFTYTVMNSANDVDTATITLTILPVARAKEDVVEVNGASSKASVVIEVLANDSGAEIVVSDVDARSAQGAELDLLDGAVRYRLPANLSGTDRFGYTITDRFGNASRAEVRVRAPDSTAEAADVPGDTGTGKQDALTSLPDTGMDLRSVGSLGALLLAAVLIALPFGRRRRRP